MVDDVLATDPSGSEVAVIGTPDDKWGEAVTAFIALRPGATIDEKALIKRRVYEANGSHQAPNLIHEIDALPVILVGKVDEKDLRAIAEERGTEGTVP